MYFQFVTSHYQRWKPGYLALGCQFQFRCVETQMSGFSFGLVSRLLKNRFQFRFLFCLRTALVSEFQFKFHPRKLFYLKYGLFKCSTSWYFCFITMISWVYFFAAKFRTHVRICSKIFKHLKSFSARFIIE